MPALHQKLKQKDSECESIVADERPAGTRVPLLFGSHVFTTPYSGSGKLLLSRVPVLQDITDERDHTLICNADAGAAQVPYDATLLVQFSNFQGQAEGGSVQVLVGERGKSKPAHVGLTDFR